MPLRHYLQLSLTKGLGPILMGRLIEQCGSPEAACAATVNDFQNIERVSSAGAARLHASLRAAAHLVDEELGRCSALGIQAICPDDETYPMLLRSIPDPPAVLFIQGSLQPRDLNAIAIVGSRACSMYGREQADRFGSLLAGAGFTVISGGARGVDSAAHRGALLHAEGRTIAVVGTGLDIAYPPENAGFFPEIARRGAVISEFPLGTPPNKENFPRRNRIVSGMSRGVLVIEANVRSGALITARQAADDHNRPVFALPGRVDNTMSAGPHLLIRDGAVLVTKLEDILDGLGPLPAEAMEPARAEDVEGEDASAVVMPVSAIPSLSERQNLIFAQLSEGELGVDQLIDRTGLDAPLVLQELTFLTLKGVVRRVDGQTFARARK